MEYGTAPHAAIVRTVPGAATGASFACRVPARSKYLRANGDLLRVLPGAAWQDDGLGFPGLQTSEGYAERGDEAYAGAVGLAVRGGGGAGLRRFAMTSTHANRGLMTACAPLPPARRALACATALIADEPSWPHGWSSASHPSHRAALHRRSARRPSSASSTVLAGRATVPRSQYPHDTVDDRAVVVVRSSRLGFLWRQKRPQPFPSCAC